MPISQYRGRFLEVTEEMIGRSKYEKVHIKGAVIVYPMDENGQILFIKEKRPHEDPPVRWKPVTGFLEANSDWKKDAQRELQEEIGKQAKALELIYHLEQRGTINVDKYFVLAHGLKNSKLPNPDGDVIEEVKSFSVESLIDLSLKEEIVTNFDTLGLFLLERHLKRRH